MTELKFTSIKNNPTMAGQAEMFPDIVYAIRDDREYRLTLLLPWSASQDENSRFPLIVFVQGSAWTTPNINYELPQLAKYAQNGYAVATLVHRSAVDGYAVPAFLEDTKCAIRFLRANAAKYHIDPECVGIWGTSSGGNTALLVGLTGDDPTYRTDEYTDQSDAVKTVVECFGPAEMESLFHLSIQPKTPEEIAAAGDSLKFRTALFGATEEEQRRRAALITPLGMVCRGKDYPPFLLIHGDADPVVPYDHSTRMAEALCAADVHTEMIRVEGAEHEGTFWSSQLHDMILDYFCRTL